MPAINGITKGIASTFLILYKYYFIKLPIKVLIKILYIIIHLSISNTNYINYMDILF